MRDGVPIPRARIRQRAGGISSGPRTFERSPIGLPRCDLAARHALLAFGLWLRHVAKADALVHMGAHGTLEWLPGKAVALTGSCFPELVVGSLPVIYPFIVSNPGEAAQANAGSPR